MIRRCTKAEFDAVNEVINDGAAAYRGVVAAGHWKEPYMSRAELRREIADAVVFWGFFEADRLEAVMGLQHIADVALIRHAYTRTACQGKGMGSALLAHLLAQTGRPLLIGTWAVATWAIRFYERHGFRLVTPEQKTHLLTRYWTVPVSQMEESVVLADERWIARNLDVR